MYFKVSLSSNWDGAAAIGGSGLVFFISRMGWSEYENIWKFFQYHWANLGIVCNLATSLNIPIAASNYHQWIVVKLSKGQITIFQSIFFVFFFLQNNASLINFFTYDWRWLLLNIWLIYRGQWRWLFPGVDEHVPLDVAGVWSFQVLQTLLEVVDMIVWFVVHQPRHQALWRCVEITCTQWERRHTNLQYCTGILLSYGADEYVTQCLEHVLGMDCLQLIKCG